MRFLLFSVFSYKKHAFTFQYKVKRYYSAKDKVYKKKTINNLQNNYELFAVSAN